MRVLIGSSSLTTSGQGIGTYVREIATTMARRLDTAVTIYAPGSIAQWQRESGIGHVSCSLTESAVVQNLAAASLVRSGEFDVVINNDNAFLQAAASVSTVPFLSVGHLNRFAIGKLLRTNHEHIDWIVAISNDMRDMLARRGDVPLERIALVYNGVSTGAQMAFEGRQQTAVGGARKFIADEPVRIIFAGGWSQQKGSDLFASSLLRCGDRHTRFCVEWFGDVPRNHQAKLAGLRWVNFRGRVSRDCFVDACSRAHVLAFPSRWEGCPMALLESMSMGVVPVIADGIGAQREIVRSGLDGFVIPSFRWIRQFGTLISHLSSDMAAMQRLSVAARNRAARTFSAKLTVENLLELSTRPTVERSGFASKTSFRGIAWHRPAVRALPRDVIKRIRYRMGYIKSIPIAHD